MGTVPPTRQPRSIHVLGVLVMALLGLCCVAQVSGGVVAAMRYVLLGQWIADSGSVSQDQLAANDLVFALSGVGELVVTLPASILFVVWLWQARRNAERFVSTSHRRHRAWVILGWFIPIVSLWFPKQVVDDVWRTSDKGDPPQTELVFLPPTRLVTGWWILYLIYMFGGNGVERAFREAATMPELQTQALAYLMLAPFGIAAAVLAIMVVRRITTMQEASLGARIG